MWFFRCANNSVFYFWDKQNYTIGRKNTDIVISNDESISRTHALLEIENNNVFLTDKGSKYGTFLKGEKLKPNEKRKLQENDQIKFGLLDGNQSKFKLQKLHILIVTSNVKSSEKKELQNSLDFLKANRTTSWSKACTHLVVSEVILTAKVLCALTEEQPIVSTKYFEDYVKSVKNNLLPPNAEDYLPEINESLLSKNIKLEYNPNRKILFQDKIFVFLTEKCKVQMAELISITGGKPISWEKNKFDINNLKKKNMNYIFMEESLDEINKNSEMYKSFSKCVSLLSEYGRRSIPLQEIALAIVYNSCEENCNPLFNRAGLLVIGNTQETQQSEQILAYDTEQMLATSTPIENTPVEVLPSYEISASDLSSISNTSVLKRPLESETNENAKKRFKDDDTTSSGLFSFRRSSTSSTQSTNISRNTVFNFPVSTSTPQPSLSVKSNNKEDVNDDENPFMKKRKATKEIAPPPKKTPLVNISNISNLKPPKNVSPLRKNDSTINHNMSSVIIRGNSWFSKKTIKKEKKDEEMLEVKIKLEDPFEDEISKINEAFKNSIIIEYKPLVVKKEIVSNNDSKNSNCSTNKNFKKFKKNYIPKHQTIIITDDQMSNYIVGENAINMISDDEQEESPEMEMIETPVQKTPISRKGRFQFVF